MHVSPPDALYFRFGYGYKAKSHRFVQNGGATRGNTEYSYCNFCAGAVFLSLVMGFNYIFQNCKKKKKKKKITFVHERIFFL